MDEQERSANVEEPRDNLQDKHDIMDHKDVGHDRHFYKWLEKAKAGLGAAGLTAVFAEGATSAKAVSPMLGEMHVLVDILIGLVSLGAFVFAARAVDVPNDPAQDKDR